MKLALQTAGTTVLGVAALGVLLFLPAGTLAYWQAWTFIVVFVGCVQTIGVYLTLKDPVLLERRKQVGPTAEQRPAQRIIATLLFLGFCAAIVVPAFDRRFGWSLVPAVASVAGDILVVIGLYITLLVLRENRFSGSSIRVVEGQTVVSTGPYAVVRHPMYTGTMLLAIGTPLALGSLWGLLPIVAMVPVLVWRIMDEERALREGLPGYLDYTRAVRHRLVPSVW